MSSPLEDYLETIYLLVQEHGFARVKDIARARDVKAATVSVALRRLAAGELVHYERREYIGLTSRGEEAARRILARHRILTRFFTEVLRMSPQAAGEQACAMEHGLSDEAMDRMVRFFEFLGSCPSVVEIFGHWSLAAHQDLDAACDPTGAGACPECAARRQQKSCSVADLKAGQRAVVTRIAARGALRLRLLEMGILPETILELERSGQGAAPVWIRCQGARLALGRAEARSIRVRLEG